jgi:1-acyl-sn-glycerol-3-phosphate acyltransferase
VGDIDDARAGDSDSTQSWSPWEPLAQLVEHELEAEIDQRDPGFIKRLVPVLGAALRYYDPEIDGFENLPEDGPFLVVGNHSGGIYMPDFWAFFHRWVTERGPHAPLYSMAFDFSFALPVGGLARKLGSVPASRENAALLLDRGDPIICYPGGDTEDYRPWTERHRIEFKGRTGFIRLALRHQVPVVPLIAHGSHDTIVVLARGDKIAKRLGLDRLRINVMPVVLGPPWGIAPVQLPTLPLPAKVTARVCEPIDWSDLGPDAADDPEIVSRCYDETFALMQSGLDDLVEDLPHPVTTRVSTALGLDRIGRLWGGR